MRKESDKEMKNIEKVKVTINDTTVLKEKLMFIKKAVDTLADYAYKVDRIYDPPSEKDIALMCDEAVSILNKVDLEDVRAYIGIDEVRRIGECIGMAKDDYDRSWIKKSADIMKNYYSAALSKATDIDTIIELGLVPRLVDLMAVALYYALISNDSLKKRVYKLTDNVHKFVFDTGDKLIGHTFKEMNSSAMSALPALVHEADKEIEVVDVDVAEFVREVIKVIRTSNPSIDDSDYFIDYIKKSYDEVELVKDKDEIESLPNPADCGCDGRTNITIRYKHNRHREAECSLAIIRMGLDGGWFNLRHDANEAKRILIEISGLDEVKDGVRVISVYPTVEEDALPMFSDTITNTAYNEWEAAVDEASKKAHILIKYSYTKSTFYSVISVDKDKINDVLSSRENVEVEFRKHWHFHVGFVMETYTRITPMERTNIMGKSQDNTTMTATMSSIADAIMDRYKDGKK